jgi:hypothetical protein
MITVDKEAVGSAAWQQYLEDDSKAYDSLRRSPDRETFRSIKLCKEK